MEKIFKGKLDRLTIILLLLGVIILVNLISINIFYRFDLTQGKIYTLAKASREVMKKLPDRLTVKAYFSKDLPAPYSSNARYLKDQLEEYRAHSNGKFHFEFVDPASEEELEAEANSYQIAPVQVNVVQADKIELKKVYMGLVFLFQDKRETIPLVQTTAGLEYDITSTIKKIIAEKIPKIGFLSGQGETPPFEEMTALAGALQKNYEIQVVNIAIGQFIDKDIDALFIIKPLFAYSDWTLFALDQYIMNGGRVGFLVNMIEANLQEASARRNTDLNLEEFTKNLGFRIVPDLVYDQKCGMINIQQRQGFFTITNAVPYPFFPIIRNFNRDIAITKGLEDLPLYFPSSVESTVDSTDSVIFKPLCWTSNKSNRMVGRYEINPTMGGFRQMTFPDSAIMVAATLTGKFTSYFNDRPLPLQEDNKPYTGEVLRQSSETRLVAIGEGNFVTDKFLASRSSADFFLNLVDWLAQDESLIHIRTREVTTRPLIDTSQGVKGAVKYANIFAPAILVIVIGIVRWQIRRKFKPEL